MAGRDEPLIGLEPDFEARWPGASALATTLLINIEYTRQRSIAHLEGIVRTHGLSSMTAYNALAIIEGAGEPLSPSTIAERMVMSRGTMTEIVDTLERHGLVRRLAQTGDRRRRLVEATSEGSERLAALRPALHQAERRLVRALSEEEQRQMLRFVAALQSDLPAL